MGVFVVGDNDGVFVVGDNDWVFVVGDNDGVFVAGDNDRGVCVLLVITIGAFVCLLLVITIGAFVVGDLVAGDNDMFMCLLFVTYRQQYGASAGMGGRRGSTVSHQGSEPPVGVPVVHGNPPTAARASRTRGAAAAGLWERKAMR